MRKQYSTAGCARPRDARYCASRKVKRSSDAEKGQEIVIDPAAGESPQLLGSILGKKNTYDDSHNGQ